MPAYAFLAGAKLDPRQVRRHYVALASLYAPSDFPAKEEEFTALSEKTELDAMVAYTQWLGHAVARACRVGDLVAVSPLAGKLEAAAHGKEVYEANCAACHGDDAAGIPGAIPSLVDAEFLGASGDVPDGTYFGLIACGSDAKKEIDRPGDPAGGMTAFGGQLPDDDIWSIIGYVRELQKNQK